MKFAMKCLAKAWVAVGGILVAADAVGFTTCKVLEKIGKPLKVLSEAYGLFDYSSVKTVGIKWLIMLFAWPISLAASWARHIIAIYNENEKDTGA